MYEVDDNLLMVASDRISAYDVIMPEDAYVSVLAKAGLIRKLSEKIKEATQVSMKVEEVPRGTLPRFEYKVRRWTDQRVEGLERVKYLERR